MTRQIPLTRGLVAQVDDADFDALVEFRWHARIRSGATAYAVRTATLDGKRCTFLMHRQVLGIFGSTSVDHRDGDGLNNTRGNLRACTHAQNNRNRGKAYNNQSGFKGVAPEKSGFRAQIQMNGRNTRIGTFADPIRAARAYDAMAKILHGDFARLNFGADRDWLFPHEHVGSWPPFERIVERQKR